MPLWTAQLWENAEAALPPPALPGQTLLGMLGGIWARTPKLCALVPAVRVVTGRIPATEEYTMPYVAILEGAGSRGVRTEKTQYPRVSVSFHIWVPEASIADGERIEAEVTQVYADEDWSYLFGRVIDVLDEGPGIKIQPQRTEFRYWEIIKLFTLCLERQRRRTCVPPPWASADSTSSSDSHSSASASGSAAENNILLA